MSEWREVKVEDIASKVAMGPFGSNIKTDNFVPTGVPVIRGGNLTGDRFSGPNFVYLTEQKADELGSANAFPGDIVFTHRGTLGQVGIIPPEPYKRYVISQSQMKLTCSRELADALFVYYYFKSPQGQHELLRNTSQTGVPAISRPLTSLKEVRLPLPPLPEQKAIAYILGTLDDKIELNRRMNQTLEAIAHAIFKSWFVDFDPVRAKAAGRQPTGLDAETAALFPDRFEESELGLIPRDWKIRKMGEEFKITMGQSPPGSTYNEKGDGLPFFQGRKDFGFRYPTVRVYCIAPKRIADTGDTLVSVRAPVGDINMAKERCCIGRGVAAARHKSESRSFTYAVMQSLTSLLDRFEAEGTVFGSITKKDFHGLPFIIPPPGVVAMFEELVYPIDQRIENNTKESQTLTVLRDTLLPKLLSGKVRVKEVKKVAVG